ncbi:ATP-binding protein [Halomonas denitrificans]|nr:hypothetical protein [Halomonas denitrificans]
MPDSRGSRVPSIRRRGPVREHAGSDPAAESESFGRPAPSLFVRLAASALVVLLVALGLIGLAIQQAYRGAAELALGERLEGAAFQVLAGMDVDAEGRLVPPDNLGDSLLARPESGLYAGIVANSASWASPSVLGTSVEPLAASVERGTEQRIPAGEDDLHRYRIGLGWELPDGRIVDFVIWAAEDRARLDETLARFRSVLWRWLVLAGLILLIALIVLLIQPLMVLRRVAGEIGDVEAGRSDRLRGRYPRELEPLTANLNALLETERSNVEQYRRALGDLAHSLKTPLAVLGTQLDDDSVDLESLRETVEQMRVRVRAELDRALRSGRRTMRALVGVRPVLERAVRTLGKLYRGVDFELDVDAGLAANVEERDLLELVGNLAENAGKYGSSHVRVSATQGTASLRRRGLRICVDDDGPGMSGEDFEKMLQRGVRGDQRRGGPVEGQGLGLSIVERIVSSYDGSVRAERSPLGGLRVIVDLPPEARRPRPSTADEESE